MALHTLNKQRSELVRLCISALAKDDSLLLYEDGVYAALVNGQHQQHFAGMPASIKLYALIEDLDARGITDKIPAAFTRVTYQEFVNLCLTCNKVVNWN